MSRNGKSRWDTSKYPQHDDDPDLREALRLSKELNDGPATTSGPSSNPPSIFGPSSITEDYDEDADFAYALELQFGGPHPSYFTPEEGYYANYVSMSTPSTGHVAEAPQHHTSPWVLKEEEAMSAVYDAGTPTIMTFASLENFFSYLRSANCPTCKLAFFESEQDVRNVLKHWKEGKTALSTLLKCRNCETSSCIACTPQSFVKQSFVSVKGKQISWCCTGGRLILLWLLLCGLDDHTASAALAHNTPKQKPKPEPKKKNKATERARGRGDGVGFGGRERLPSGMGYGSNADLYASYGPGQTLSGHRFDAHAANVSEKAKAMSAQQTEDQFHALHLQLIEGLLPSFERESLFDFDPPDAIAEMLVESKLLDYCAELLRNDSLEDATKRSEVYKALISILRTLGAHYATASSSIYNKRAVRKDKSNLLTCSFGKYAEPTKESTSSLLDGLNNLHVQSELVLRGAKANAKEFRAKDAQDLLLLCRQIVDLWAYLDANSGAGTKGKANGKQAKVEVPALLEMPDKEILKDHAHANVAKALKSNHPGRFRRLITEITALKTGLPPGIFIRHAESRPDVQKVIIIGPVGTPYENGLFEFDVWCDGNFPNTPPLVQFKTTGGGRVAFNPNLYPDGKVCLSLLGTWQGEPWIPNESTLLQVFISIQAMILCEEPWYNEPGRELSYRGGKAGGPSESYNQTVRQHTVRTAMLEWLDKPPSLWKDVIDQHFTENADKILHTAVKWSKIKVDPKSNYLGAFSSDEDEYEWLVNDKPSPVALPQGLQPPPSSWSLSMGRRGRLPRRNDLPALLQQLQESLKKYGASDIVPKEAIPDPTTLGERPTRPTTTLPDTNPPVPHQFSHFEYPLPAPPPLYSSPAPSYAPSYGPSFSSYGRGGSSGPTPYRGYSGAGRVMGNAPGHILPLPSWGRGGPSSRAAGPELGRYETRSSTQGRGASSGAHADLVHSSFEEYMTSRGRGSYRGHGPRGDRGGPRGDRSGRGGRGGRGGIVGIGPSDPGR